MSFKEYYVKFPEDEKKIQLPNVSNMKEAKEVARNIFGTSKLPKGTLIWSCKI